MPYTVAHDDYGVYGQTQARETQPATSMEPPMDACLSPLGRAILDFETHSTLSLKGEKQDAMRENFGMTETRYHQVLFNLIQRPEALAHAPMTVNRLRRLVVRGPLSRRIRASAAAARVEQGRKAS